MMYFQKSQLNALAAGVIKPGEIYRMKLTQEEGVKPKNTEEDGRNKYFVVLGTTDDGELIGFVLINSEINQRLPQEIKKLQYKINTKDYPFLKKDSYICCSELKHIETYKFFQRFQEDAVAVLSDKHMETIKNFLAHSPRVTYASLRNLGLL